MKAAYAASISEFRRESPSSILGRLSCSSADLGFDTKSKQVQAWTEALEWLGAAVDTLLDEPAASLWSIALEFTIPLRQKRPDAVIIAGNVLVVLEFKVGATGYARSDLRQVEEYCLDLRDFHAGSAGLAIVPVLVATRAPDGGGWPEGGAADPVKPVVCCSRAQIASVVLSAYRRHLDAKSPPVGLRAWLDAAYRPVPSIIDAAEALYAGQEVRDILHTHAANLTETTDALLSCIEQARDEGRKLICFVTGIPGAGKTLVGLNLVHSPQLATQAEGAATFLSGNGPLVAVMREALARDTRDRGECALVEARRRVSTFIQNVHDFMREYTQDDRASAPHCRVAVFDEAQRAWNREHAARKFGRTSSEPMAMLEVMDRHPDWAVVVALVGGGQEIHTGEAGLEEWGRALNDAYRHWGVVVSPDALHGGSSLAGSTLFGSGQPLPPSVTEAPSLHLSVSVRSWRAEAVTAWVDSVLAGEPGRARALTASTTDFPIALTRSLSAARQWLRSRARGDRRCGLIASSGGLRLRAYGLELSSGFTRGFPFEEWWLAPPEDVRSSYQLEVPASEFECQGLELDWAGLCWSNDLAWNADTSKWRYRRFAGSRWQNVLRPADRTYMLNKYRVLLTRAREGMVIWAPPGDAGDPTVPPSDFDATAAYLEACGVRVLD